jgi:hypothetical protein
MQTIDLKRLRDALPKNGTISLAQKPTPNGKVMYLDCKIQSPSLSERFPMTYEKEFELIKQWQREIIGKENISEFYTLETGHHWHVYLRRVPMEFINL